MAEGGVDLAALELEELAGPAVAYPFVAGVRARGRPVEGLGVGGASVEEGFDLVGFRVGQVEAEGPLLRILVEAEGEALFVAVAETHDAADWFAALGGRVGRVVGGEGGH